MIYIIIIIILIFLFFILALKQPIKEEMDNICKCNCGLVIISFTERERCPKCGKIVEDE